MRTFEAVFTPGTRAIASPSAAANETPSGPSTMYAALTWSVTADSTDLRRPAPSTATTVTSVSPTISAAAVDAVRLGLRTEFELARSPAIPPLRRAGAPTSRASGFTRCGAASATPRNKARMPMPSRAATAIVLSPLANTPTEMAATEPATTTTAAFSECAAKREGGRIEPSRTAAIGGTRVARRAGRMLATSVMSVPSASEMMMVLGANTRPASGRSEPTSAFIALAMPTPAKSPTTEARRPITRPSSTTERITCLREPPSVRSVANSRVRWATVIDSVLKITNAPTNRAMPPKPSRK